MKRQAELQRQVEKQREREREIEEQRRKMLEQREVRLVFFGSISVLFKIKLRQMNMIILCAE